MTGPHVHDMHDCGALELLGKGLTTLIQTENVTDETVTQAITDAGLTIGPDISVNVHQNDTNTMHVALPSKVQLEHIHEDMVTNAYQLCPNFCEFDQLSPEQQKATGLEFYNFRLGDYVIQHCR